MKSEKLTVLIGTSHTVVLVQQENHTVKDGVQVAVKKENSIN